MRVAGFGFRASATADSLRGAFIAAGGPEGVDLLATAEDKAGAACLASFAQSLALRVQGVSPGALAAAQVETLSAHSLALRGTGSLAEAAALAAARAASGKGARLITARVISPDRLATCAIAETGSGGNAP